MVTTLYLIRHGETRDAHPKRYKGNIDVPLSENGENQMEKLSKYIVEKNLDRLHTVYSSDLSRAVKSAEIIAKPHGLKPVIVKELRERNFGIWEGMSFDEIKEQYPVEFEAWAGNPLKFSPMEGESTLEVKDRSLKALNDILEEQNNRNPEQGRAGIAIVSHGGIIRIVLCYLLGIPLDNIFRIEQDFGALNIVEFHDNFPVVKLLNRTV
jgi:alpha-ribazole phosphatase/probable phosphoglycerate mutase